MYYIFIYFRGRQPLCLGILRLLLMATATANGSAVAEYSIAAAGGVCDLWFRRLSLQLK
jgi:hypothetical protein